MKGVILSGGLGTRLRPITHTGPKQLIPVANKPVIQYAIEDLKQAGITSIGVILGNKGREEIQRFLGDGSSLGVSITYIVQGKPLGLAHAVGCAREFVGDDDFTVYLGDNITKFGINDLTDGFESNDYAATLAIQSVDEPSRFGIVELDDDGNVTRLVEKPDDPPTDLALIGTFVFSPAIFEPIESIEPSPRGELEITDAIRRLLDGGHAIDPHVVDGWWKDTGKPADIIEANRFLLDQSERHIDGTIEDGATVTGKVELMESAVVKAGAVVRGPVSIAGGTIIEEDTYVGPFTSIGPDSTIANAHVQNSVIIGEATINTDQTVVDSLIGRGVSIGSSKDALPEGQRFVVGRESRLQV
jgi:glucose-1-phosphate thymidylyltransferase